MTDTTRIYVCFDDTDNADAPRGTGKVARWYEDLLPEGCTMWGVVRQQLLFDPRVPMTSHNSSACAVILAEDPGVKTELIEIAMKHIEEHALPGSDPGLCAAAETDPEVPALVAFGRLAAVELTSQDAAREAVGGGHLSGHGGTNDGVIGAAAGVGLTSWGWSGRFIEFRGLRDYPETLPVADLEAGGMLVLPVDRNVVTPKPGDIVHTYGWLRPRLMGGRPVVPVMVESPGVWMAVGKHPGATAIRGAHT